MPGAWPAAVVADGSPAAWSKAGRIPEPLVGLTSCQQSLLKPSGAAKSAAWGFVLPLGMGGVAVLQPFGPGRGRVCIGQLWSDSAAGDIVLCHLLHLFSFMAILIYPTWVPHFQHQV